MFSKRVQSINTSGIRAAFNNAAHLKNPINLSIGQPFFDALESCKAGAISALQSQKSGYGHNLGVTELREKLKQQLGFGQQVNSDNYDLMITAGVSGGFNLLYCALLDPGDQVVIPDPFFGIYRDVAQLLSAEPVYYDLYPNFRPTAERIEQVITPRTKLVVVNSPSNPSGVAISQGELDQIIELCRKHDLWLAFDEIYSELTFDREPPSALFQYEKAVTLNGFSKSFGIPGWRIGYVVARKDLIEQLVKVQQYTYVCAPTVLQWGVWAGIGVDLHAIRDQYRQKRDFVVQALSGRYQFVSPEGAFFMFPKSLYGTGQEMFSRCLKHNLLIVPGNAFSRIDTHFRISFSASQDQLEKGVEVLNKI